MKKIRLISILAIIFGICSFFAIKSDMFVKADNGVTPVNYAVSNDGIYITDSMVGSVRFQNKETITTIPDDANTYGKTILTGMRVNLSESFNASTTTEWDGMLVRFAALGSRDIKFQMFLISNDIVGRDYNSKTDKYEIVLDKNGNDIGKQSKGFYLKSGYITMSSDVEGTLNYKFSDINVNRKDMTAVSELYFGIRNDANSGTNGIAIASIALYKADAGSQTGYTVKTLFNSKDLTKAISAEDTTAGVNLLNPDNGTVVNTNMPARNNTGSFVAEEYVDQLDAITNTNFTLDIQKSKLVVKYVTDSGTVVAPMVETQHEIGETYTVEIPQFAGYQYISSTGELSGTISGDTEIVLTYSLITACTQINYKGTDVGVYETDGFVGGIRYVSKSDLTPIPDDAASYGKTICSTLTFNFNQKVDGTVNTTWDGLLIHMKNTSNKDMKFNGWISSRGVLGRNYVSSDSRQEIFIDDTGLNMADLMLGVKTASGYYTISKKAEGTWNYRFADLKHNRSLMDAIDSFVIGLRMGDKTFYGCGLVITSISAYRADSSNPEGYVVETLFNSKDVTIAEEASDTTSGINLINTDNGSLVHTANPAVNNTGNYINEEYREQLHSTILNNINLSIQGCSLNVNYVDEEGDSIANGYSENYTIGDSYTISTPEILGYIYKESNVPLTGTITTDLNVNVVYKLQTIKLKVNFVDEEGKTIHESVEEDFFMQDYLEIEPDSYGITGYTYKSADGRLKFTIMRDTEITLTFSKNAEEKKSGCGSSINVNYLLAILSFAGFVMLINGKKLFRNR